MGLNLSRSDKERRHNHIEEVSEVRHRHHPRRYKKQQKRSRLKSNNDLYKKALVEDYNAWLESLPSTNQDCIKHDQKNQTLMRKVKNLLCSKSHRKSSVVWPDTKSEANLTHQVAPKIQLSFSPNPASDYQPCYEKTSWDFYYPTDVVQASGSFVCPNHDSISSQNFQRPSRRSCGVQTSPIEAFSLRSETLKRQSFSSSQETTLTPPPEDIYQRNNRLSVNISDKYLLRRHSADESEQKTYIRNRSPSLNGKIKEEIHDIIGKKRSWPRTSDYESVKASPIQQDECMNQSKGVYDNFYLYKTPSEEHSEDKLDEFYPKVETSYNDRVWRKDRFSGALETGNSPNARQNDAFIREREFSSNQKSYGNYTNDLFHNKYPQIAQENHYMNQQSSHQRKKKKSNKKGKEVQGPMNKNLEADIEKMVIKAFEKKFGISSTIMNQPVSIDDCEVEIQQVIERRVASALANLFKDGNVSSRR